MRRHGNYTFTLSIHLGIGRFFVPESGKTYKASLTFADGSTQTVDLPKQQTRRLLSNLNNTNPDTIQVKDPTAGSSQKRIKAEPGG